MEAHRERDVVCGMMIDPAKAAGTSEYDGKTYYFCGKGCKAKFDADPSKYVKPGMRTGDSRLNEPGILPIPNPRSPIPTVDLKSPIPTVATKWTCPMHPEIIRDGPGSCPICGMALEPLTITAEEPEKEEIRDMTRRFWVSVALTIPTLAIGMADLIPGKPLDEVLSPRNATWAQLLLATPVILWGGWPFFVRGWHSVINRSLNMFTLIALGVGVAFVYSVV